jgi:uncharacterized protein (TIGR03083 family)
MTSPSFSELTAAVRSEGEGIVAAGRLGLDVPVPTCGQWVMSDLLRHVGEVYEWVGGIVGERLSGRPDSKPSAPADVDPVDYLASQLDELVEALSSTEPDTPVWNWSAEPDVAAFWARRMAHESSVHRYDAQRAHSLAQPIDAELAHDGMDELIDVLVPRVRTRDGATLPEATIAFLATDEGSWNVRLSAASVERLEVARDPDVTVRGTTSALLLAAYNRVPWTSLEVSGDSAVLDGWSKALQF